MNKAIESWNRHHHKVRSLPDGDVETIVIDEDSISFRKVDPMAERTNMDGVVIELPRNQLRNIIRMIIHMPLGTVNEIRTATYTNMKRLGVKRDPTKAANTNKPPKGSSQVAVGSVVAWMRKITSKDTKAIKQLVAIDATCCARVGTKQKDPNPQEALV